MIRAICAECHEYIAPGDEVDHGYRRGSDGREVERWACPSCDELIHDDAMGHLS